MAVRNVPITTFRRGIVSNPGFAGGGGADEIRDMVVDRHGRLALRGGHTAYNTSAFSGLVGNLIRARYDTYTPGTAASMVAHLYNWECSSTPLKRIFSGSTTPAEMLNYSTTTATSYGIPYREALYPSFVMYRGRLFFSGGMGTNKDEPCWTDIGNSQGLTYKLGHAVPTTPTGVDVDSGTLTSSGWYGYSYTFYNSTYGHETDPSATDTEEMNGKTALRITLTKTQDQQWNKCRIYMTQNQSSSALASAAEQYLVATVTHTPGTGTFTADITAEPDTGEATPPTEHDYWTLGTTQGYPVFMEVFQDVLWCGILPRTIRFSLYDVDAKPDWFPIENEFTVGDSGTNVTGLITAPNGGSMLIFTNNSIIVLRGNSIDTIDMSYRIDYIGCGFPRTIKKVGGFVYFLGNDNSVWRTDGQQAEQVSSRVDSYLSHIERGWGWIPCAGGYKNTYRLSYPSSTPLVSTSSTTTNTGGTANLFAVGATRRVTDASAWDLSAVKVGMWAQLNSDPTKTAVVVSVNDGSDWVEIEDCRGLDGSAFTNTGKYDIIANQKTLVYDATYNYWTLFNYGINAFSVGTFDRGELVAARADDYYVDTYDSGTTDNGTSITGLWKGNWIFWTDMGGRETVKKIAAANIIVPSGNESTITLSVYRDGLSTADVTVTTTIGQSQFNRLGVWSRGHSHQIEISGASIGPIESINIEVQD